MKNTFLTQIHADCTRIYADFINKTICSHLRLRFIFILILICGLTIGHGLIYGQDDHLTVKGDTRADSLVFSGDKTAYPAAPLKGEVFYHSSEKLRYFDGTIWRNFGGGSGKTVATKIVAAWNSIGSTREGTTDACVKSAPCNNPRADYVCNGWNDQWTIRDAIAALGATGGVVYLLEGTYNIAAPINLDALAPDDSGKAIIGTGGGTILKMDYCCSDIALIKASNVDGILISQLMIDGAEENSGNRGILFIGVTHSKIDKVWVEKMTGSGISLFSSSNNTVSNSNAQDNDGHGIYLDSSSNNNSISNNNAQGNANNGIYLDSSSNNNISNNNSISNNILSVPENQAGIYISGGSNNIISGNNVQDNKLGLDECGGIGIYIKSSSSNIISNNNAQGNGNNGIYLDSSSNNNSISNNNVQGNARIGITAQSNSHNNVITGNVIYDNGGSGAYDGIKLDSSDNNIISSNRIYDSKPVSGGGYGINLSANTNYLTGNLIDGAGYTNRLIQDLGTGTKYTDKAKLTLEQRQILIPGAYYTLLTAPARSYVAFDLSSAVTLSLENGRSAGDMLILENTDATWPLSVKNYPDATNVRLNGILPARLDKNDILTLIWDGTNWVQIGLAHNP